MPDRLAAGPHPVIDGLASYRDLSKSGIDVVIDLVGDGPAGDVLPGGSDRRQVEVRRHPIRDFDVPTESGMGAILDDIDLALESGATVYVHCAVGVGRTGMVVGCWMVRNGACRPEDAVGAITMLRSRAGLPLQLSPETSRQRDFVTSWIPGT